jgi:hypothetical protein
MSGLSSILGVFVSNIRERDFTLSQGKIFSAKGSAMVTVSQAAGKLRNDI